MLIRVEHGTSYEYSEPLLATTQYLRMTPLSGGTQAVESWALTCPGASMTQWQDQYGNVCHTLTLPKPVDHLDIKVCGLVRTRDTNGVVGTASSELPSMLYLRETPYTVVTGPIRDFAGRFSAEPKEDLIKTLHEIMLAVADKVSYAQATPMCTPREPRRWSRAAAFARIRPMSFAPSAGPWACRPAMSAAI